MYLVYLGAIDLRKFHFSQIWEIKIRKDKKGLMPVLNLKYSHKMAHLNKKKLYKCNYMYRKNILGYAFM